MMRIRPGIVVALLFLCLGPVSAQTDADWEAWERELTAEAEATFEATFNDRPLTEPVVTPPWFRLSFLHLGEDLDEAARFGKRGLVVYFGQKYCPYCKALMEKNFGRRDIALYTRRHFDVVAVDVHGDRTVTDLNGVELSERHFAEREKASLTPTLLFYDTEGREALKLVGYHPPYQFRAALEYVVGGHYRAESFRDYLERAEPRMAAREGQLNDEPFFPNPPHNLDRSRIAGQRPLIVFFEQPDCHACDVLHGDPLQQRSIQALIARFDTARLDIWADTPVVTPAGRRTTAHDWAQALKLFYTPTLLVIDEDGGEILRVDSVAHFYRLKRVLEYALSGAHRRGISLQRWQREGL